MNMRCFPGCISHRLAVTAYSPFGHDDFPGPETQGGRVLAEIAEAHDATPRQVALAFLVRHPAVFAIPKASNPQHTAENAGAAGLVLTDEEIALDRPRVSKGAKTTDAPYALRTVGAVANNEESKTIDLLAGGR